MGDVDFPTWFGLGSYGGLGAALLAAAGIAGYALRRRRGSPLQLARAILVCLAAASLMLAPIWWTQNRLNLYGPALASGEVLLWLCWTALFGWLLPLSVLAAYVTLAAAQLAPATPVRRSNHATAFASLDDPARRIEPLGPGHVWAELVPLEGESASRPIALTRQLTLLGRELDNDIVIDDERTSRHHAELHWDHGRPQLVDRASMNGTLLNRQTVHGPVPLKPGDVIELGAQRYRFETPVPATTSANVMEAETSKSTAILSGDGAAQPTVAPLALVAISGPVAGVRWEVRDAVITIGRDQGQRICLPDESVSRQHAQIVRQRAGYFVADLASSNGTFLDNVPLEAPGLLAPGAMLRVGNVELRCEAAATQTTLAWRRDDASVATDGEASAVLEPMRQREPDALLFLQRAAPVRRDDVVHAGPLILAPADPDPTRDADPIP
jgi:pSer/pThr/pTyr-binding forkhead associated (FHA) protein